MVGITYTNTTVTVKVIDEANEEILCSAVWPKEKIYFDFVDGEFISKSLERI